MCKYMIIIHTNIKFIEKYLNFHFIADEIKDDLPCRCEKKTAREQFGWVAVIERKEKERRIGGRNGYKITLNDDKIILKL